MAEKQICFLLFLEFYKNEVKKVFWGAGAVHPAPLHTHTRA